MKKEKKLIYCPPKLSIIEVKNLSPLLNTSSETRSGLQDYHEEDIQIW